MRCAGEKMWRCEDEPLPLPLPLSLSLSVSLSLSLSLPVYLSPPLSLSLFSLSLSYSFFLAINLPMVFLWVYLSIYLSFCLPMSVWSHLISCLRMVVGNTRRNRWHENGRGQTWPLLIPRQLKCSAWKCFSFRNWWYAEIMPTKGRDELSQGSKNLSLCLLYTTSISPLGCQTPVRKNQN